MLVEKSLRVFDLGAGLQSFLHESKRMENAVKRRLRAEAGKNVVIASEKTQLLEVHVLVWPTNVLGVEVLDRAEKFAHEVDHDAMVHQIDQLADLAVVGLLGLRDCAVQRHDEVVDEALDSHLALVYLRVDLGAQLDQESDEAGEVEFV